MGLALEEVFRYPGPSRLAQQGLRLATFSHRDNPIFFRGSLLRPQRAAQLLRALMAVVHSRYHIPARMLERLIAQSDPVVTSHESVLRFEGFSACCGVYARADFLANFMEGERLGRGTTNVDFSPALLAALAGIEGQRLDLTVGAQSLELEVDGESFLEKKVRLPLRWLKSLTEVPIVMARMRHLIHLPRTLAVRFLRSLPRTPHSKEVCLLVQGRELRVTPLSRAGHRVTGLHRLFVLEPLLLSCQGLDVYHDPHSGACAFQVSDPDCRFSLVLSPELWRGFSGEGQLLESLTRPLSGLPELRARLAWQASLDLDAEPGALSALSSQGLLGFDLALGRYFHRELPFELAKVEQLQPRLREARQLLEMGAVRVIDDRVGEVESGGVCYRVIDDGCTCPWFARHRNERGPCKHLLALHLKREEVSHDQAPLG